MGERPGALAAMLAPTAAAAMPSLPDLALGLPSEVALRRPDIRAAEARLHSATAKIGVAKADLYPSRSEKHTSELQSLMRISYAVFCLKKKQTATLMTYDTKVHRRRA